MMVQTQSSSDEQRSASNGVVVPHPLKWHQRLAASLIYCTIRAMSWTLRYQWEFHPDVLKPGFGPAIFCIWHNRLFLALLMYDGYVKRRAKEPRLAAIVSASKDGGLVARILEHFGTEPVRGSSSRRGPQALLELTTWAERGYDLAITPDGPRGPRCVVQHGLVSLAHLTGLPVVPSSLHLGWKIRLRSWDRFQVPLPFSRCVMKFGEPIRVPQLNSDDEREKFRREIEERLKALTVD